MIQKVLTAVTLAAAAIGADGYTQDALSNRPTCGDIDPADADASVARGSSLIVGERVIRRTFDESLAEEGIAFPIVDARFDVSELDLEDPANNQVIGQTDSRKDNERMLQIFAFVLAPAEDSTSAIFTFDAGAHTLTTATASSMTLYGNIAFGINND